MVGDNNEHAICTLLFSLLAVLYNLIIAKKKWLAYIAASIFVWFVPSIRIFLAKAVYMVIGSSYLSSRKILALGTSTTPCM